MEIYQFRQLVAVAETSSFTRAAAHLGVSQPALSAGISKLEEELGVVLFRRDKRSVHVTLHGQRLVARARQVLDVCSAVRAEMRANDALEMITLGVMPSIPVQKVSAIVKACQNAFPNISLDLREGDAKELHDLLAKDRLDLAIVSTLTDMDDAQEIRLMHEPYMLACHIDHPFAKRGSISLMDIHGENFILRTTCEARSATEEILRSRGIRTKVVARTAQDDRALNLVAAGIGLALMPALFAAPSVTRVRVPDLPISRNLVVRKTRKTNKTANAIFQFLREKDIRYL